MEYGIGLPVYLIPVIKRGKGSGSKKEGTRKRREEKGGQIN
jgi:hypothetical protein